MSTFQLSRQKLLLETTERLRRYWTKLLICIYGNNIASTWFFQSVSYYVVALIRFVYKILANPWLICYSFLFNNFFKWKRKSTNLYLLKITENGSFPRGAQQIVFEMHHEYRIIYTGVFWIFNWGRFEMSVKYVGRNLSSLRLAQTENIITFKIFHPSDEDPPF